MTAMSQMLTAVVQHGCLRPAAPLDLPEGTEVRIVVLPASSGAAPEGPTTWPCKAGSARDIPHWMAPDFDAPLDDFRDYTG